MYSSILSFSALLVACSALPRNQVHMALTESEIQSVFDAESHSAVPEYQLVNIRARTRRSAEGGITKQVSLDAFGERYDLNLEKNEDLMADQFDIFYADPAEDGKTSFQRAVEAELLDVGDPYQDREAEAALLVHHDPDNDALLLDGTVGTTLVIRPVPGSAHGHIDREAETNPNDLPPDDEFFLDDEENLQDESIMEDGFPLHHHQNSSLRVRRRIHKRNAQGLHFVYHRSTPTLKADYGVMELDSLPTAAHRRRRRSAPSVIYPEVLIIIDYDGFLLHDQDNNKIKKYFTSFMNGVDLRYKQLRNPEIKVNIAGMIISRGADATPYLEQNKVTEDSIDSAAALTAMGKYLFEERRLPTYDIAMAITKHDLCRRRNSGKCTKGTAGFAYVGGACVVNKRLTKVNSVAIVEDTGGFSGIIVAAHELGHLLGNVHDGSPPPSYLGGPGAKRCRWEEGFIMSDLRHTEKGFKWSPCSLEEFDHFLNGETATCLYNAPHERNNLDRHLPGKLLSLDAQCKRDRGTSACFKDDRVCAQLFCFDQATGYCVSYRPAAEGSPCGVGKYCRDGYCVTDDSAGNGFGRISYGSSDYFTSATQTRPVWTDPPAQTTEKSTTKKTWSSWGSHRSTREIHGSTETTSTTARSTTTTSTTTTTTTTVRTTTTVSTTTTSTTTTTPAPTTRSWWTKRPKNNRWTAWRKPSRSTTTTTTVAPTTTTTTTTTRRPTTRRTTTAQPSVTAVQKNVVEENAIKASSKEAGGQCVDRVNRLVGHLSCKQFIQRYGYRYCSRKYVQRNCCASHKRLCANYGAFSG